MVERKYGYKKTKVNGTKFTIKERYEGTDLSSAGRRLAVRDDIRRVRVDHDGTIEISVGRDDHWAMRDVVPEGFQVVGGMVHPSTLGDSAAHLDLVRAE